MNPPVAPPLCTRVHHTTITALLISALVTPACQAPANTPATTPVPAAPSPVLADLAVEVSLPRALAFAAFTDEIQSWWDHHFSQNPYRLRFEARAGGAFVEEFDDRGNGAQHARVVYADRGRELRFIGPLGLSGRAVEFVHTVRFIEKDPATTRVELHIEVMGALSSDDRETVRSVWQHFFDKYRAYCEARPRHALFAQPPIAAPARVGLGFFSHIAPGAARNHRRADDFSLVTAAHLTGVTWWGHIETGDATDLADISHFLVQILAVDIDGSPGALIAEFTAPLAGTAPGATGRRAPDGGPIEWKHTFEFPTPVAIDADKTYFLSIAAGRRDAKSRAWQWTDADGLNNHGYTRPLARSHWTAIQDVDSAFELHLAP